MPPKIRVTKEEIVETALELVRTEGAEALNARAVAVALGCSTQPVFSNFASMEELRLAVVGRADALCNEYIRRETESGVYPAYKASGIAYIRFASEERELFKLLYMRDRSREAALEAQEFDEGLRSVVKASTGLDDDDAALFHLEMWAFVHGIASMFATGFVRLEWELVSRMMTDVYKGLRKRFGVE